MLTRKVANPKWQALALIPLGLVSLLLAALLIYDNFINDNPAFRWDLVFVLLCMVGGIAGLGTGVVRLFQEPRMVVQVDSLAQVIEEIAKLDEGSREATLGTGVLVAVQIVRGGSGEKCCHWQLCGGPRAARGELLESLLAALGQRGIAHDPPRDSPGVIAVIDRGPWPSATHHPAT